jgi:hypothetical protein
MFSLKAVGFSARRKAYQTNKRTNKQTEGWLVAHPLGDWWPLVGGSDRSVLLVGGAVSESVTTGALVVGAGVAGAAVPRIIGAFVGIEEGVAVGALLRRR